MKELVNKLMDLERKISDVKGLAKENKPLTLFHSSDMT